MFSTLTLLALLTGALGAPINNTADYKAFLSTLGTKDFDNTTFLNEDLFVQSNFSFFPRVAFMVSADEHVFQFNLQERSGIVYLVTFDELFKQSTWFGGEEIVMTVEASNEGVAVFLTDLDGNPMSLKPTTHHEYFVLPREILDSFEASVYVNLISLHGTTQGTMKFGTAVRAEWVHMHLIIASGLLIAVLFVLLRKFTDFLLNRVYSYQIMTDEEPSISILYNPQK